MGKSITFIVKATKDRHKVIRCLNSLKRQTKKEFNIIAFCSIESLIPKITESYSNIKVIKLDSAADFTTKLNEEFKNIETDYCAFINFDEVTAPNLAAFISVKKSDAVVFNISKKRNNKYIPRFREKSQFTLAEQVEKGLIIWNIAIKTSVIKANNIELHGLSQVEQALFLLECFSFAKKIRIYESVLVYKDSIPKKGTMSFEQFQDNCIRLEATANRFKSRNMPEIKEQIISDFVIPQLENCNNEKKSFKRMKMKQLVDKYMGL